MIKKAVYKTCYYAGFGLGYFEGTTKRLVKRLRNIGK